MAYRIVLAGLSSSCRIIRSLLPWELQTLDSTQMRACFRIGLYGRAALRCPQLVHLASRGPTLELIGLTPEWGGLALLETRDAPHMPAQQVTTSGQSDGSLPLRSRG